MYVITHATKGYNTGPGGFNSRQDAASWLFKRAASAADLFNWRIVWVSA